MAKHGLGQGKKSGTTTFLFFVGFSWAVGRMKIMENKG
jgi:hypothetical protein